ncbi:hypothetical protein Dimus_032568 [Dionaea muscipula]
MEVEKLELVEYRVKGCFRDQEFTAAEGKLRPRLDWVNDNWVPSAPESLPSPLSPSRSYWTHGPPPVQLEESEFQHFKQVFNNISNIKVSSADRKTWLLAQVGEGIGGTLVDRNNIGNGYPSGRFEYM